VSGQRKALIVANDEYEGEGLRNLLAPAADAEALGRVLSDPGIGEFAVKVIRNEPSHVIQAHIEDLFSESRHSDVLLLHFSGHGLKSESGELFFAAPNTRPNRLGSTAVAADFVQRCMRHSRSRSVVLLLDCCYGGAFAQGVTVRASGDVNVLDSFPQERSGGGRGRAVITASNAMEYAFEGDQITNGQHQRPSVFTAALVEGLATGKADRDEDGWVSLDELYEYVFDKVREKNPHQTPSCQVDLEGELYVARSPRRPVLRHAAPIPADLQTAITDPNIYARIGAVSELRSRLVSEDLAAAEGARKALAELARTDVRYVADPAAAALAEAAPRPAPAELHFGSLEQGSAPPRQAVQLLGPPIARICVPRLSHDWITVNQTTDGLDVSIDTAGTGNLHGVISLQGPAGAAAITIEVDLVSPGQAAEEPAALGHGTRFSGTQTSREGLKDFVSEGGLAADADTEASPVRLSGPIDKATSKTKRPSMPPHPPHVPTQNPDTHLKDTSSRCYPPIDKRFWYLAVYLLPVGGLGVFGFSALALVMFKCNRRIRMNAVQSLEIHIFAGLTAVFGVAAFYTASPATIVPVIILSALAGISALLYVSLLLYCLIKLANHQQPRIGALTRIADQLARGRGRT
jgi:hypothetical protein